MGLLVSSTHVVHVGAIQNVLGAWPLHRWISHSWHVLAERRKMSEQFLRIQRRLSFPFLAYLNVRILIHPSSLQRINELCDPSEAKAISKAACGSLSLSSPSTQKLSFLSCQPPFHLPTI